MRSGNPEGQLRTENMRLQLDVMLVAECEGQAIVIKRFGVRLWILRFCVNHQKVGRFIFVFLVDLVFFVSLVRLEIRQKLKVPALGQTT